MRSALRWDFAKRKPGLAAGIYAKCSAHPWVLQAAEDGSLLLVKATSNPVNQFGGNTGIRPGDSRGLVQTHAR